MSLVDRAMYCCALYDLAQIGFVDFDATNVDSTCSSCIASCCDEQDIGKGFGQRKTATGECPGQENHRDRIYGDDK